MAPAHPFAAQSVSLQQQNLLGKEAFPFLRVAYDSTHSQLLLSATHQPSQTEVHTIASRPELLSSIGLWWAVFTERLPQLDRALLNDKVDQFIWSTYAETINVLIEHAAHASEVQKTDFLQDAANAINDAGPNFILRNKSFEELCLILAGEAEVTPKLHRLKLLWWLAHWAATKKGKRLALSSLEQKKTGEHKHAPEESTLTKAQWEAEVRRQTTEGRIATENILSRIADKRRTDDAVGDPNSEPLFMRILRKAAATSTQDIYERLELLLTVPMERVRDVSASLLHIVTSQAADAKSKEVLSRATTPEILLVAMQSAWTNASQEKRKGMTEDLKLLLDFINEEYATSRTNETRQQVAKELAALRLPAEGDTLAWSRLATAIAKTDECPSDLISTVLSMQNVRDFRQVIPISLRCMSQTTNYNSLLNIISPLSGPFPYHEISLNGLTAPESTA